MNKYSQRLLAIMITLIVFGGLCLWDGNFWGLIPFVMGGLMMQGFREPEASPSRVWIITFMGQKTECLSRKTTLLLDWLPLEIVGKVEIPLVKVDHNFPLKKPIYCPKDGGNVYGTVSLSFMPDCHDDVDPTTGSITRSGAEKLSDFDNAGGVPGVEAQLDNMMTVLIGHIANGNANDQKDTLWMETHENEISEMLKKHLDGECAVAGTPSGLADATGLGVKFTKLNVVLKTHDKVIEARDDLLIENAQRRAEIVDTETTNQQIEKRLAMYLASEPTAANRPTVAKMRKEIFDERQLKAGKFQTIVNEGGVNVADVTATAKGVVK